MHVLKIIPKIKFVFIGACPVGGGHAPPLKLEIKKNKHNTHIFRIKRCIFIDYLNVKNVALPRLCNSWTRYRFITNCVNAE